MVRLKCDGGHVCRWPLGGDVLQRRARQARDLDFSQDAMALVQEKKKEIERVSRLAYRQNRFGHSDLHCISLGVLVCSVCNDSANITFLYCRFIRTTARRL